MVVEHKQLSPSAAVFPLALCFKSHSTSYSKKIEVPLIV